MSSIFSQIFNREANSGGKSQNNGGQNNSQGGNGEDKTGLNDPNNPNNKPPADPLAPFAKLFDTTPNAEAPKAPSFKLDPNIVKSYTESLDFSKSVTPEILAKLKSGDDSGFHDLANALGRQIAQNSLESHTALTERFVDARSKYDQTGLDQSINSRLSKNSLESIAANNPIAKKHMETIAEDLLRSNPDASPEWIKENVPKYFLEMARLTNPDAFNANQDGNNSRNQNKQGDGIDWNDWLTK